MERSRVRAGLTGGLILLGMTSVGLGAGWLASGHDSPEPTPSRAARAHTSTPPPIEVRAARCGEATSVMSRASRSGALLALSPDEHRGAAVDTDNDAVALLALSSLGP